MAANETKKEYVVFSKFQNHVMNIEGKEYHFDSVKPFFTSDADEAAMLRKKPGLVVKLAPKPKVQPKAPKAE